MKPISIINLLPGTMPQVDDFTESVKNSLMSGAYDVLETLKHIKAFEKVIKSLLSDSDVKGLYIDEAYKYPNKTFEHSGCAFTLRNNASKYDYKSCNDEKYNELEKSLKERKLFLQSLKGCVVIEETGEIINPPTKTGGGESVIVTLNK